MPMRDGLEDGEEYEYEVSARRDGGEATDARGRGIEIGSIVQDLGQQGIPKMLVVGKAADTCRDYERREDFDIAGYKTHVNLPVQASDAVFECVYLPDEPGGQPAGNNPYAFPSGRLARVPIEAAGEDVDPVQVTLTRSLLVSLFATASADDMASSADAIYDVAAHAGIDDDLLDEALELAAVDDHFDSPANGGGRSE